MSDSLKPPAPPDHVPARPGTRSRGPCGLGLVALLTAAFWTGVLAGLLVG